MTSLLNLEKQNMIKMSGLLFIFFFQIQNEQKVLQLHQQEKILFYS